MILAHSISITDLKKWKPFGGLVLQQLCLLCYLLTLWCNFQCFLHNNQILRTLVSLSCSIQLVTQGPGIRAQKHYLEEIISKDFPYMNDINAVIQFFVVKLERS